MLRLKYFAFVLTMLVSVSHLNGQNDRLMESAEKAMVSNQFESAQEIFTQVIEKEEADMYWALCGRAVALKNLGKTKAAKKDLKRAKTVPETNASYWRVMARCYYVYARISSSKGKSLKAIKFYKKTLEFDSSFQVYNSLGYQQLLAGKYEDARLSLNKAIDLNPNDAYAHNNLALALIKVGKYDLARIEIDKSKELDPSNPYVYKHSALLYLALEDYSSACAEMGTAVLKGYSQFNAGTEHDSKELNKLINTYCKN